MALVTNVFYLVFCALAVLVGLPPPPSAQRKFTKQPSYISLAT